MPMAWRMPSETAPHERIWMAFPVEGTTLGDTDALREEGYAAWTAVAAAIAAFEPVTMLVDPSEIARATRMLPGEIEILEAPVDEFWMRDHGPTFVVDDDRPARRRRLDLQRLGSARLGGNARPSTRLIAEAAGRVVSSLLVNEGGGIHVDGEGTVLLTETVQLDPRRNRYADRARVEAEIARTLGTTTAIWLPRGLTRDYDDFGTNGHVDIVATSPPRDASCCTISATPATPITPSRASFVRSSRRRRMPRVAGSRSSTCPPRQHSATRRASSTGATSITS
jgi:agmatine deiminase